jgi:hypothetical protein
MLLGQLCRRPAGGLPWLLRDARGSSGSGEEGELEGTGVRAAEGGFEDALGVGVEDDREHGFGERGVDLEGVAVEGEGGFLDLLGGGLLAFDGGQGGDEGGVQG